MLAYDAGTDVLLQALTGVVILAAVVLGGMAWAGPLARHVRRNEEMYDRVLRRQLLMNVSPRTVTLLAAAGVVFLGAMGWGVSSSFLGGLLGAAAGAPLPALVIKLLRRRRLYKLEEQLVDSIQTLTSAVRAGLNLIQAMDLLARNDVKPVSEEFGHLVREYEHGVSLEQAMQSAAARIGSSNYRLLFSALQTHRERGGDLSETLDRIADSIREIHRLEKRIESLTAPGRTAARWMGAMPLVILLILWAIDSYGVSLLFNDPKGRTVLLVVLLLNALGFLWIRKIVTIDV